MKRNISLFVKWVFDRVVSFIGLVCFSWLYAIIAILIKIKMPGPVLFVQKRVGKGGKMFKVHKFRSMAVLTKSDAVTGVAASEAHRITPLGEKLRRYKLDELPELWDVLIGGMSFVGPRPDIAGYADLLEGKHRRILRLRPGITGPASLKYRNEEELITNYVREARARGEWSDLTDAELAQMYNDTVIYPDKCRLNYYYFRNYSFYMDIKMIFATVLGRHMIYANEEI